MAHPDIPDDPDALLKKYRPLILLHYGRYRKYLPPGGDSDGLLQELRMGLFRAAELFDPSRNFAFMTVAYQYLHYAALHHLKRECRRGFVGIPRAPGQFQRPNVGSLSPELSVPNTRVSPVEWDAEVWSAVRIAAGKDWPLIRMRYIQALTLNQISKQVGITKEGIRQRLISACRRIRTKCDWLED